jgi:hypothetical protein
LELRDLLEILSSGTDHVLGNQLSPWRNRPAEVTGWLPRQE